MSTTIDFISDRLDVGQDVHRVGHAGAMQGGCDHDAVLTLFRSRRSSDRQRAVEAAAADEHADQLLAQMLDEAPNADWVKVLVAAELGDVAGTSGDAALRRALDVTGPHTSDLRCASVLALANRCREAAHDDYVRALGSKDSGTRDCAVMCLAAYGRDGVWDTVATRLVRTMKRRKRRGSEPSDTAVPITYLARHLAGAPGRTSALGLILRQHWAGLDPDGSIVRSAELWLDRYWPEVAPGGPDLEDLPAPDADGMTLWLRTGPLFSPLG